MSRIWEDLKRAEKQQTQSPRLRLIKQAQVNRADHRKNKRSETQVPLLVYGLNVDKQPFHEDSDTLNVNDVGCLLSLETPVVRGQRLFLVNLTNQDERECRVVRLCKLIRGKRQVAVEFLRSAPEFWFDR